MDSIPGPLDETLDPEDWSTLKALGHRMVDDLMDHLSSVREGPVWRPVPESVRERLRRPLPLQGEGAERAYRDYLDWVRPWPAGNLHPRFWGWVIGSGVAGRRRRFAEYGLQLTRGFRALKVWMGLKEQGVARLGRLVEQNVAQARELAERVDREPELERLAPVPLNVVCLRYRGGERDPGRLDALNRRLLVRLQESGAAVPSHTLIGGRFAIRVCLTNHRTRREDLALLVEKLLELGRGLEAEAASGKETRE